MIKMPTLEAIADASMPQMTMILDETIMGGEFDQALFGKPCGGSRVQSCEIQWIKYKPAQNCTVCYRLTIDHGAADYTEQFLYGRIYADGGALKRVAPAQAASPARPRHGEPIVYLASVEMLCWLFPNDRKLDGLAKLTDGAWLSNNLLPEVVGAVFGADWRLSDFTSAIVHFVPEHNCTLRVDIEALHDRSGAQARQRVYGKTYYNGAGAETYRRMCALWQRSSITGDVLGLAQPIAYQAEEKILWQAHVAGETLLDQGIGSAKFLAALAPAAAAVAALHGSALDCCQTVTRETELTKLTQAGAILSAALPAYGRQIHGVVNSLLRQAEDLPRRPDATLHGDLHIGNIITNNGKAALIDLDALCRGPALYDIGSFIAALIYHGIVNDVAETELTAITTTFCAHYRRQIAWEFSDTELHWYVAAALIAERLYRCVTRLKFKRGDIVGELLAQAERLIPQDSNVIAVNS